MKNIMSVKFKTKFIYEYVQNHNITLRKFAKKCGITYYYLCKLLKQDLDNLLITGVFKIAKVLGRQVRELFY